MKTLPIGPHAEAPRTSLAVTDDGGHWLVVNATRDLPQALRERPVLREAGLAVLLLDAEVPSVAGLLALHDGPPLDVWATPKVFEDLTTSLPLLTVLQHYGGVRWHLIPVAGGQRSVSFGIPALPGLAFTATARGGTAPRYATHRHDEVGNRIALEIRDLRDGDLIAIGHGTSDAVEGLETAP